MYRYLVLAFLICPLVVACGSTPTPALEQVPVTLKAAGEESDVSLYKEAFSPLIDEIARLPSGTECTLLGSKSEDRAHGVETMTMYQVNCGGTIGWVGEASLTFAPGEDPSQ